MSRICIFCCAMLVLFCACGRRHVPEDIDWTPSLSSNSRAPYGTSIVWESLPRYFPSAEPQQLNRLMRYTSINDLKHAADSPTLFVMIGLDYYITDEEWASLLQFARAGNELFILSSNLDEHLARGLHLLKHSDNYEEARLTQYNDGTDAQHALRLLPDSSRTYGYTGRYLTAGFERNSLLAADTFGDDGSNSEIYERRRLSKAIDTVPEILGTAKGRPDFVRYRIGVGHITLHAAPLVLSNYFLLQPGNRSYLDSVWHSFPANISAIWWNEYYKRSSESSSWSVLLRYPAMRWALLIACVTLLLYVLFGMKRLQRIVPIIQPVENTSVAFVETVGKLYFNRGVHANLAEKMVQHFLEWVRSNYYLDTSQLSDAFTRQLAAKSGKPETEVASLINSIHDLRLGSVIVTPDYLYHLYRSIQSYYKTS